jgi:serine/threonine protein kinase/Tol biopolymer transport system component
MTLSAGSRLGPYEIVSALGAGGMGEVYRARDTRLERTVAIKVLPEHLSASPESRQRFEREARTISRLSHPHICALYDIGRHDDIEYLVMEYLEGQTLADRLAKGRLTLEQTLTCGMEIADALDKAHRQGIVHRDLKPGNAMLTRSGVKLLDFGLAKAMEPATPTAGLTALPTREALTQEGTILGTTQYMSPEQLEGKDADARTDIFALGATLYEMATGKKAFTGSTQASLISAILRDDPPPISQIQPMSPPALDRVVKTCLAKDPEDRWQSAADIRRELQWIAEGSAAGVAAPLRVASKRRNRERLAWTAFALATAAALALGSLELRRAPESGPVFRTSILPPEKTQFSFQGSPPALSPDGRRIAFQAGPPNARGQLWVRSFEAPDAQPLPGTEGGSCPFWSPDSRFLGFFADGKLKRIDVTGGTPQMLADAPGRGGGTWGREGVILFTTNGPLHRVPESGGASSPVTRLDEERGEFAHFWPVFLPDGRHFLYLRFFGRSGSRSEPYGLYLGSLDSKDEKELSYVGSNVAYAPAADGSSTGYLLYVQARVLVARPFDSRRLEFTGEAFPVAEQVRLFGAGRDAVFSVSANGVLVFQSGGEVEPSELSWFDRSGKRLESLGIPGDYNHPRISHDGRRVVFVVRDTQSADTDLWLYEFARHAKTRFTFGPAVNIFPVWSPDDSRIVFASNRQGPHALYQRLTSGAGEDELVLGSRTTYRWPTDWSPDGHIAFQSRDMPKFSVDVGFVSAADRKATILLGTLFDEWSPQFSPDGRWLAYASKESGEFEIYVQPFPGLGQKWQVSTGGGNFPRWRRDGKEIFFIKFPEKTLMVAEVKPGSTFAVGAPKALFQTQIKRSDFGTQYDVSPDGSRFLISTLVDEGITEALTVVQNWTAERKKK